MPAPQFPPVGSLVHAIRTADNLDAALAKLAAALDAGDFEPIHTSLLLVQPDGTFRIEGFWSALPSVFSVGTAIAPSFTPVSSTIAERLLGGHTLSVGPDDDLGLLSSLMQGEGIKSAIVVPVIGIDRVVGVLSVSSGRPGGFTSAEMTLITGLVRSTEESLLAKLPAHPPTL